MRIELMLYPQSRVDCCICLEWLSHASENISIVLNCTFVGMCITLHKFLLILPLNTHTHFLTAINFVVVGNLYRTTSKSLGRLCVVVLARLLMAEEVKRNPRPLNIEGRTCRIMI